MSGKGELSKREDRKIKVKRRVRGGELERSSAPVPYR